MFDNSILHSSIFIKWLPAPADNIIVDNTILKFCLHRYITQRPEFELTLPILRFRVDN